MGLTWVAKGVTTVGGEGTGRRYYGDAPPSSPHHHTTHDVAFHQALVTGANGYLGSELVKQLMAQGYRVKGLVRSEASFAQINHSSCSSHQVQPIIIPDLSSPVARDQLQHVLDTDRCDVIFHTAGPFIKSWSDAEAQVVQPWILATENVLKAAAATTVSQKRSTRPLKP